MNKMIGNPSISAMGIVSCQVVADMDIPKTQHTQTKRICTGLSEIMKVLALTALSIFLVLIGLFLTSITYEGDFLDLLFEVCSAFGTVGLSRGATGELDEFGRAMIVIIMFVGRLGPLTLAFFLATQSKPKVGYPAGKVFLG